MFACPPFSADSFRIFSSILFVLDFFVSVFVLHIMVESKLVGISLSLDSLNDSLTSLMFSDCKCEATKLMEYQWLCFTEGQHNLHFAFPKSSVNSFDRDCGMNGIARSFACPRPITVHSTNFIWPIVSFLCVVHRVRKLMLIVTNVFYCAQKFIKFY